MEGGGLVHRYVHQSDVDALTGIFIKQSGIKSRGCLFSHAHLPGVNEKSAIDRKTKADALEGCFNPVVIKGLLWPTPNAVLPDRREVSEIAPAFVEPAVVLGRQT